MSKPLDHRQKDLPPADLLAQEVDIAVRTVAPTQQALVAKKVAVIPLGFFASAGYLERRGAPATISDLAGHDLIGSDRIRGDLAFAEKLGPACSRSRGARHCRSADSRGPA